MTKNPLKLSDFISIALQALLSFAFSGGIIWLFTQFKEYLPNIVYLIIIILIALFLVAFSFRLVFGDLLTDLVQWIKREAQRRKTKGFINEFNVRWLQLSDLIEKTASSANTPSAEQEKKYGDLRLWFISNRSDFTRIWHSFEYQRVRGAVEKPDHYSILESVMSEQDSFSFFYQPMKIGYALQNMDVLRSYGTWNLDEGKVAELRYTLAFLTERILELRNWVK